MTATTKKPTMIVSLSHSEYGTPRPQIELRFPPGTSHRLVKGEAHALAGRIELATPAKEAWLIRMMCDDDCAWVWIEVIDGFPKEVDSGMKVLREVAG